MADKNPCSDAASSNSPPLSLRIGVWGMWAQAIACVVGAGVLIADIISGSALVVATTWGLIAAFVAFAVTLNITGVALLRGSRWPRGLVVTWQLLFSAALVTIDLSVWIVAAGLVVGLATLIGLLHPQSSRYLNFTTRQT